LWDTAGQERYKSITKMYYKKSDAIIFVYDITNKESFENLKNLYKEVNQIIDFSKIFCYIVGNKNDQYLLEQVKKEEAQKYANSINAIYRCVSALEGSGINELFDFIGRAFFKKKDNFSKNAEADKNNKEFSLDPNAKEKDKKNKKSCC
jgi:small GTP-binding protein